MSNETNSDRDTSVIRLIGGVISEIHLLMRQQLALFRYEVKGELGRFREAGLLVTAGLATAMTGGVVLCGMFVQLLASLVPDLPLWGCYGVVGVPVTAIGGMLFLVGIRRLRSMDASVVSPPKILQENSND